MSTAILIKDWTGRFLFEGDYRDKEVDKVLDKNKCKCSDSSEYCLDCDGTGYIGEFSIEWKDDANTENVYEYVNY